MSELMEINRKELVNIRAGVAIQLLGAALLAVLVFIAKDVREDVSRLKADFVELKIQIAILQRAK